MISKHGLKGFFLLASLACLSSANAGFDASGDLHLSGATLKKAYKDQSITLENGKTYDVINSAVPFVAQTEPEFPTFADQQEFYGKQLGNTYRFRHLLQGNEAKPPYFSFDLTLEPRKDGEGTLATSLQK